WDDVRGFSRVGKDVRDRRPGPSPPGSLAAPSPADVTTASVRVAPRLGARSSTGKAGAGPWPPAAAPPRWILRRGARGPAAERLPTSGSWALRRAGPMLPAPGVHLAPTR